MKLKFSLIAVFWLSLAVVIGCDRRSSTSRPRDTVSFSVDMTIVRDLSTGYNSVDITFKRENEPFSEAIITIGTSEVPNSGGGIYFVNDPGFALPAGINEITFESPGDNYMKTVSINIPGNFSIEEVSPRFNVSADPVYVSWSASSGAGRYLLVVATEDYGADGTSPFFATTIAPGSSALVPDTTFRDSIDEIVNGIYYVYVIAFNDGLGPFIRQGPDIPMPENLPERFIGDPSGFVRHGTVAPLDSIIVDVLLSY
jgi:hypothetical protein